MKNAGGNTCFDNYEDRLESLKRISRSYDTLRQTYASIKSQSPGVRLYVVGYPQIAKPGGNCGLNVHLDAAELQFSSQIIDYLDGVISQAAAAEGVRYVDVQHAFDGHRLCEAGGVQSAMNGLTAGNDAGATIAGRTINIIGAESYHPTQLGHQLLAASIAEQTSNLTSAMPVANATLPQPQPSDSLAMLQGVPKTGRAVNQTFDDSTITSSVAPLGVSEQLSIDGKEAQLQPGASYAVELHSTPVPLTTATANQEGNIEATFTIPSAVPPDMHTLHVYGKNLADEPIDIQKIVHVAPEPSEQQSACVLVAPSGQDVDGDGTDDACDPSIGSPQPPQNAPETQGQISAVTAPLSTGTIKTRISLSTTQATRASSKTNNSFAAQPTPEVLGESSTLLPLIAPAVSQTSPIAKPSGKLPNALQYAFAVASAMTFAIAISFIYRVVSTKL